MDSDVKTWMETEGVEFFKSMFFLQDKFLKSLIHDDYYNEGYILNFRKD